MALSIKDAETDRLVRRYARLHGTTMTKAIKLAVTRQLRSEGEIVEETERERIARDFLETMRGVQARVRTYPVLDARDHADMLYDEDGLPK